MNTRKECDLIMKGGITSGVVYPEAVLALHREYDFRSIGGASAGAIAAAATAAAQYGEATAAASTGATQPEETAAAASTRATQLEEAAAAASTGATQLEETAAAASTGATQLEETAAVATTRATQLGEATAAASADTKGDIASDGLRGFAGLKALNEELCQSGKLIDLFQPTPAARPLLEVFLAALRGAHHAKGWKSAVLSVLYVLGALARTLSLALLLGALTGVAICIALISLMRGSGPLATLFCVFAAFAGAVTGGLIQLAAILLWVLPKQGFGICRLHVSKPAAVRPPLTDWLFTRFDEMAGMAGAARPITFGDLKSRNIQLELITTNLSELRPYILPFESNRLLFNRRELEEYFPKYAVDHLELASWSGSSVIPPAGFFFLPPGDQLPIGFAARLSLSFPILISAVPLYTIRVEAFARRVTGGRLQLRSADLKLNWFSDGGICSNFPIHFFDHWLPKRPTFGISLGQMPADRVSSVAHPLEGMERPAVVAPEPVHLPKPNHRETAAWHELNGIVDLLTSVFNTMMTYRDAMQSQLPGFRERIVEIRLTPDEGGLNLDMNPGRIRALAEKGSKAGDQLLHQFNFDEHRWVRLQVLMPPLVEELEHLLQNENKFGGWPSPGKPYPRNRQWMAAMHKCLDALASTADGNALEPLRRADPKPPARVRVAPKI